ncbi:MAG: cytochrome b/b6 domain-containing protein [Acidimicrobiales bacterium]
MRPSPEVRGDAAKVVRFDRVERAAHWLTAALVLVLVVTGAILYIPAFSVAVGRRLLIEDIHVYVGVCVFAPLVISLVGWWGRALRRDLTSMNRFTKKEVAWLRSFGARGHDAIGKFNPGEKLNTYAVGALLVMLLFTGIIMRWGSFASVSWRTSATFVHDWFAVFLAALIVGHILFALTHPASLRSMVTGRVTMRWVKRHAPAWAFAREDAPNRFDDGPAGEVPTNAARVSAQRQTRGQQR